jgi:hypothetical protein
MGKISAKYRKASGSRTSFFVINRRKGFKTFPSKECAELARCYQMILSAAGYAPKVYSEVGRIAIGMDNKTNKPILSTWGYVVQKVRTLGCKYSGGGCVCERCECARCDYEEQIQNMCDSAGDETGISIGDRHLGNFGIMNGKLVVLDTGIETFNGVF